MVTEVDLDEVLEKLTEQDRKIVETYIQEIQDEFDKKCTEVEDLESDIEDLEDQVSDLEFNLQNKNNEKPLKEGLQQIIKDKYFYSHKSYDTWEKIMDRIEYMLKYMGD